MSTSATSTRCAVTRGWGHDVGPRTSWPARTSAGGPNSELRDVSRGAAATGRAANASRTKR
eukprot:14094122-Alexandrium_andersonii.AAC.1